MKSTTGQIRRQAVLAPATEEHEERLRALRCLSAAIMTPPALTTFRLTPKDRLRLLDHLAVQIFERSGGQICLYGPHYTSRWRRLWVQHTACGNWFFASVAELTAAGYAGACPHCNLATDLSSFGNLENLRRLVNSRSQFEVEIFTTLLGTSRKRYLFYCRAHRRLYLARFDDFLQRAGTTNDCPDCASELSRANPRE